MVKQRKLCCLVPARAGSKGLRHKNLEKIGEYNLVDIAVNLGKACGQDVAISTDIEDVQRAYQDSDILLRHRPDSLSGDNVPMSDVIKDAITALALDDYDIILLQPTSPLRTTAQLESCIGRYYQEAATLLVSVCSAPSSVLKYYIEQSGQDGGARPITDAKYLFANRQSLPPVWRPNGAFYIFSARDFLRHEFNTKKLALYEMDEATSLDVDTADDLATARALAGRAAQ